MMNMLNDVPNLTIASGVREIGFSEFIFGALEGGVSAFKLPRTRILEAYMYVPKSDI